MEDTYMVKFVVLLHVLLFPFYCLASSEQPAAVRTTGIDYIIRKATLEDKENLKSLYHKVASILGGLARTKDEISDEYISKIVTSGVNKGLFFVAEYNGRLIGSMVKCRLEPAVFSHILSEGSILVDPEFQGMGIGSKIISIFLKEVEDNYPEILRVEIIARESNPALKLYERLGFKREGRFESRIRGVSGKLEADIPMVWLNPKFVAVEQST